MPSFQAKIGLKRPRKRENKNYRSVPFRSVPFPTRNRKFQKNSIKIQKVKKYNSSFQAKIGCKTQRKRENKNYHSVPFPFLPYV